MSESTLAATPAVENWSEQKTTLRAQFPILNDADLHFEEGKKEEMLSAVQTKLGKTDDEFKAIISAL